MEESTLVPFVRENLDILFVGLNPAKGSSRNRHYFSVDRSFWNQLYSAGLITTYVDMSNADDIIFGSTIKNYRGWSYGITDLVTNIAESNSKKIKPTRQDCQILRDTIYEYSPKTAILLHSKVLKKFLRFLGCSVPASNSGELGKIVLNCETMFFNIAFPHGNNIPSDKKVVQYEKVKQYLLDLQI